MKQKKPKINGKGDCCYITGQFAMNAVLAPSKIDFIGEPCIVHAEVRGQGKIEGLRYAHAWIEDEKNVYEFSNGNDIILPKFIYYIMGDIHTHNPKKYMRYTFSEARKKMLETGTYGTWDIETLC
jgi:hypothetical protein